MIDLLVDRLRWPAALVRERAAEQIAKLIVEGRQDVSDALLEWIGRQTLESRAASGILPFLKAQEVSNGQPVSAPAIADACCARSVLSELFLNHYDPSHVADRTLVRHSGWPPVGWDPPEENNETKARGLGKSLFQRLESLERGFQPSLVRQFEFELAALRGKHGDSPNRALRLGGTHQDGFHPGWYALTDENAASAYLRTLAWAGSNRRLPQELIPHLAAIVSPVDLDLWGTQLGTRPEWWPDFDAEFVPESVDAQIAAVIQKTRDASNTWGSGTHVVLAASGCIFQSGLVQHELDIRSFFQQAYGPLRPSTEDILKCVRGVRAWVDQQRSPLRFEGTVSIDDGRVDISDWSILPCSGTTHPAAVMSWQAWRGIRQVQCPSDALSDSPIRAVCREHSVDFESQGGLIATWSDWSSGLSAISIMGLPPATGWVLTAPRGIVEKFSREVGMRLCWAWELTSHFRDGRYDDFQEYRYQAEQGASSLAIA